MADELAQMIRERITTGNFKLASGRPSSYYVDLKPVLLSHRGLQLIGPRIMQILQEGYHEVDAVGGPELFAVPITCAVLYNWDVRSFVVRKDRKDHGTKKLVEGSIKKGDRICVFDDVATSGGSIMRAISAVEREFQTTCKVAVCILDRQEGADEHLRNFGVELRPLFRINTLAMM